jgi:hypothetical protein
VLADFLFTAEQAAAMLDPGGRRLRVVGAPARQALDPDGQPITIHDAVLHAVRRR